MGTNHTSLGARLKGETSFTAEDIEDIAALLKLDATEFYRDYLAAANDEKAPTPKGEGRSLPGLDSNQEPAGFKPSNVIHADFGRPQRDVTPRPLAAIGGTR